MEMKIISRTEEPLLSRTTIKANVTFADKTPSKEDIRKAIASSQKAEESKVVVKMIDNSFGKKHAVVDVCVYGDEATMKFIEERKKKEKKAADAAEKK